MSTLLVLVGVVLLVAGPVMVLRGAEGRRTIGRELAEQKIRFPGAGDLPPHLARYAGVEVRTGEQALAFAGVIATNLAHATAGRSYAEIVTELHGAGAGDPRLSKLRETAFMGQALRGSLLGAYQAWQMTLLVIALGGVLIAVGLVFVGLAATLL
jgi:hypothetical protein